MIRFVKHSAAICTLLFALALPGRAVTADEKTPPQTADDRERWNVRLDEAYFGTGLPHKELLEVFRAHLLFAGAESPHFRVSEEVAKADLDEMEEEARASETAWARLRARAGNRDSSAAADDSPSARK